MYLAILSVNLLFTAHSPVAHVKAVLDAPALEPRLSADFYAQSGLQIFGQGCTPSDRPVSLNLGEHLSSNLNVILDLYNCCQKRMIVAIDYLRIQNDRLEILQNQPGKPLGIAS